MLDASDIKQIKQYVEAEILRAFADIYPNNPTINTEEEEGIIYLMHLLDNEIDITTIDLTADENSEISPAVYLDKTINRYLDQPLEILTPGQKSRIDASHSVAIKIHIQLEILKFLKEYQDQRAGLKDFQRLSVQKQSALEQALLQIEKNFYEKILQEFPAVVARNNKAAFYCLFFVFLTLLGIIGLPITYSLTNFSWLCFSFAIMGLGGTLWTVRSNDFMGTNKFKRSLPNDMRNSSNAMIIYQVDEKLQNLNSQLEQLRQSQLSTTAQLLQTTPAQETVAEKYEEIISAPPLPSTSQLRQRSIKTDKSAEEKPSVQKTF